MMRFCVLLLGLAVSTVATSSGADTILAARTIRAQAIIGPADITIADARIAGSLTAGDPVIGMEARVSLYPGRPIRPGDIGPPAIVERNQLVPLVFRHSGVVIETEGRALGRGGEGDRLRVMNIASRNTLTGIVRADGVVVVTGSER